MTGRPVPPVVTGVGAVSPAGLGADALWRAVTAGAVRTGPVTRYDLAGYPTDQAGEVPATALSALDGLVPPHPSLAGRYLAAAALEALRMAGLHPARPGLRVGAFVGTVMGVRPLLDRGIARGAVATGGGGWASPGRLLEALHGVVAVDGPAVLAAPGCAAGNTAVALGAAALAAGEVDVALCAGADELSLEVFAMFTSMRGLAADAVRPFDAGRAGTMPAEGAGVLLLESAAQAAARGARPLAALLAHASRADAHHMTRPRPDGAALAATVTAVLDRARIAPGAVDWVCAHGTGTPASDGVEARALAAALAGADRRPPVSSVKGVLGHAVGAAAALEAVVAAYAIDRGFVPGNPTLRRADPACAGVDLVPGTGRHGPVGAVLSPAFGFGGAVTTLLLGRPPAAPVPALSVAALSEPSLSEPALSVAALSEPAWAPPAPPPWLAVLGAGVALPGAAELAALAGLLERDRPPAAEPRWFDAPHTDLSPVEVPVAVCRDEPEGSPRSRGLPRESSLAVRAATGALAAVAGPAGTGTVWASSTAGLAEYGQMCVEAATLEPGLASPLTGPQAAYNGPASAVSLRHVLTGPQLTLTGGVEAGAAALTEAGRLLAAGECPGILVGASAGLSRWRLAGGAAAPGPVPAEGAVCLRLGALPPGRPGAPSPHAGVAVREVLRARVGSAPVGSAPVGSAAAGSAAVGSAAAGGSAGGAWCPQPVDLPAQTGQAVGRAVPTVAEAAAAGGESGPRWVVDDDALAWFVKECVARMSAPPTVALLSACRPVAGPAAEALRAAVGGCRHVERVVGDLGAAGGLLAVAAAVAAVAPTAAEAGTALVVAVGATGDAVALEVTADPFGHRAAQAAPAPTATSGRAST